ncbi:ATP-binding protein [Cupriavidus taiwanensis]|uniref:histidine kinase n=1 Tax=Cupriavidus taiwanensis TaxID=164546 RepID=A0A375HNM3_9BURK|nr:ATP-binding protein [Cupriavidus taiwanensis]SOY59590.1 Putative sensory histidine kinase in two-component regulatory system; signal peptide [Cupriavidus taiwanensis]SOY59984.1 Putative sensory histidine kinase in two-component regulatory system; signal peptide [Cupriavidus taiwanensis]SOY92073.1 Putative sensory histidine kinase in two-component regulatory system; signal peptide [Cupriavidus taiwanensis]SOZ26881.1 Putative sensory histidine kinase in two-component regulatory system; signal 
MRSIQRTLLGWLAAGLVAGIAIATALIYGQARQEANALFDYQMKQMAAALPSQFANPVAPPFVGAPGDLAHADEDVVIHIWDGSGRSLYLSHSHPALPARAELGFSNVTTQQGEWRLYSMQLGPAVVQIAQPMSARRALAARMALRTVAPLLLLLPLLAWLVWMAVGRGLRPLREIATEVRARDANTLAPLAVRPMPDEIAPLSAALNQLLARLSHAIDTQRAFVADAAHALRTPLTALQLQAQLVERADEGAARDEAIGKLRQGLERLTHLVTQLLTLARQEPGAAVPPHEPVELHQLAAAVVAEMAQAALDRDIDLGLDGSADAAPAVVRGDADALRILLTNLLDNALAYIPAGGRIDVAVRRGADGRGVELVVSDNGPGIPAEERARVFDRFYRVADAPTGGSGLGLAIVAEIAQSHGARVVLEDAGPGLRVRVVFRV